MGLVRLVCFDFVPMHKTGSYNLVKRYFHFRRSCLNAIKNYLKGYHMIDYRYRNYHY